jgi:hypothetical protein
MKPATASNDEGGSVLLLVVFLISFTTLFAGTLLRTVASDLQIINNHKFTARALYVAEAGLEHGIAAVRGNPAWTGGTFNVEFPAGSGNTYSVSVTNNYPTTPSIWITSTGENMGYRRTVQAEVILVGDAEPYDTHIMSWREL